MFSVSSRRWLVRAAEVCGWLVDVNADKLQTFFQQSTSRANSSRLGTATPEPDVDDAATNRRGTLREQATAWGLETADLFWESVDELEIREDVTKAVELLIAYISLSPEAGVPATPDGIRIVKTSQLVDVLPAVRLAYVIREEPRRVFLLHVQMFNPEDQDAFVADISDIA